MALFPLASMRNILKIIYGDKMQLHMPFKKKKTKNNYMLKKYNKKAFKITCIPKKYGIKYLPL